MYDLVEIGFGNGESLVALAAAHRDRDYLGIEVHRPGIGHLMLRAEELGLGNVRAICRDAVEVLQQCVAPGSLAELLLYFPDPWPKKRHHKRRFLQSDNLEVLLRCLKPGGQIIQTQAAVDVGDLISKYAFGDVKKEEPEKKK